MVGCHRRLPQLVLSFDGLQDNDRRSSLRGRLIRYLPLVLWVGLIFFFSSTAASASQTSRIIGPLLHFLFPSASPDTLQQYHFFIRKCAHVTEYALLAFWAIRASKNSSYPFVRRYRFVLAVVLVLIVASLDEFNQSFEPSRTSTPWDVGLDFVGGVAMSITYWLVSWARLPRPKSSHLEED